MTTQQEIARFGVEVPDWYKGYVKALGNRNFLDVMKQLQQATPSFLEEIPEQRWDFSYAPGKWTIRELVMHMMDAERIFAYRTLRFARNDATELEGFDEDAYIPFTNAAARSASSLISEYKTIRAATISLFESFDDEMMMRIGKANGNKFSVLLSGVIIVGHEMHHLNIIRERYL
ncbi:MAG: DinB family protein [Bacteroidetes bacterium]|nr:DinB family protein [Bacteroidota bacterium]